MSDITDLIDRYIAMWNETDDNRRRALVRSIFHVEATYADPVVQGEGVAGIDAMVKGVQERFPGHRFRRTSMVDSHNGAARFGWELGADGEPNLVAGVDFAVISGGRLKSVVGFFDPTQTAT